MTALNFGKSNDFHSDKLVAETTTLLTFYNSENIEKKKEVATYNERNKKTSEFRYNESNILEQRLTRMYDSTGIRSIARRLDNYHPLLGRTSSTAYHGYDSNGFLNRIIEKDQSGSVIRQTEIVNNEKGYPMELKLFVGNQLFGIETAEYDYETNEVLINYFNNEEEFMYSEKSKISAAKNEPEDILNEFGDVIKSATYEMKIKYDKYGNWVRKMYFQIINGKLIKKSDFTRTIKYRR